MSADLAVQKAVLARLAETPAVTDLVPATSMLDRHARPSPDPAIIVGEGQTIEGDDIARHNQRVVLDLHIWKRETSLEGVKAIGGAIRAALHSARPVLDAPYHCGDIRVSGARWLRDPDGETSHGVVTVQVVVSEVA